MEFNTDELYAEMESYYNFILEELKKDDFAYKYKGILEDYYNIYNIPNSYDSYVTSVEESMQSIWNAIINFFKKLGSKIREYFGKFSNWVKKILNKIFGEDDEKIEVPVEPNTVPEAETRTENGITTAIVLVSPKETVKYNKLAKDKLHYLDTNTYTYILADYPEINWENIIQSRFDMLDEAFNNLDTARAIISSGNYTSKDILSAIIYYENSIKKLGIKDIVEATKVKERKIVLNSVIGGKEIFYKNDFEVRIRYQIDERTKLTEDALCKRINNGDIERILNEFASFKIPYTDKSSSKPINLANSFQKLVVAIDKELREILKLYSKYEINHYTQAKKLSEFILKLKFPTMETNYNINNLI